MIRKAWEQILANQDVRQNLSKIRQEIKNKENLELFCKLISGQEQQLINLLDAEDAKTRKNTALLMGDAGKQQFLQPLWAGYQQEKQRFVKSSYLAAIGNFDYREYLAQIKDRLETLNKTAVTVENQKHHLEEVRELSSLVVRMEGVKKHTFNGFHKTYNVVLLTNRNFTEVTSNELIRLEPDAKIKSFGAGVIARVNHLHWIGQIRTYQELLFVVKGMETCSMDPVKVAEMIVKSQLLEFMAKSHNGEAPYYFRVELKSKRELDQKSVFVKKLSAQIEQLSDRKLINTTDNYEMELRIIENKDHNCNILVKLFTLQDDRFLYKKEAIPTSIKPVNAALTVALAREFMKPDAQVLDPFCGVGTMLIERHKAVSANTTYGIDIQEEAILKARRNTEVAGQIIHYVNRDFFRFQHDYLFDEIITNMPFRIGRLTDNEVFEIYQQFFGSVRNYMKKDGVLVLYTHNKELVDRMASKRSFRRLKEYEISQREGTYVLILQCL